MRAVTLVERVSAEGAMADEEAEAGEVEMAVAAEARAAWEEPAVATKDRKSDLQ